MSSETDRTSLRARHWHSARPEHRGVGVDDLLGHGVAKRTSGQGLRFSNAVEVVLLWGHRAVSRLFAYCPGFAGDRPEPGRNAAALLVKTGILEPQGNGHVLSPRNFEKVLPRPRRGV